MPVPICEGEAGLCAESLHQNAINITFVNYKWISPHFILPRIAPSTEPYTGFFAVTLIRDGVLGKELEGGVIRSV